jgi:ADP-heptose:LPS heptosyltransferase
VDPAASRRVRDHLRQAGIDGRTPFVVLHPGASAASRRYRWQGFAAAARRLGAEDGLRILITGSPDERALTAYVAAEVPGALDLAGSLDSDELAALIAIAPVLTTNNTGPAHLAAALGTPVVVLYAQTNLQHTPWLVPSRVITRDVPCRNCLKSVCPLGHHACLAPVTPEEIVAATREMLATGDGAARQAFTAESLSWNSQESAWNTTLRSTSATSSPPDCPTIDVTHSATVVSARGPRAMSSASAARRARTR